MSNSRKDKQITILHFLADGRTGGPGVRIARIDEGLKRKLDGQIRTIVASPPVQPADFYEKAGIAHVELLVHKPNMEAPLTSGVKWLLGGIRQDLGSARILLRRVNPSVVHVNGAIMIAAVLAARLEHIPCVWHLNDNLIPRFMGFLVRTTAHFCNTDIIATSRAVVQHYGLPNNTTVIYPPAPKVAENSNDRRHAHGHRVGVLSNVVPPKRVHEAVEMIGILAKSMPNLHLEIAGRILGNKFYYYDAIQRRISELGIEDRVKFLGFVVDPIPWLSSLDLLVFPSENESAGLAIIEALTCGTPVVGADIPSTREIGGDSVIRFPVGDVRAMAAAVKQVLTDRADSARCVAEGLERANALFGLTKICDELWSKYSQLLGNSRNVLPVPIQKPETLPDNTSVHLPATDPCSSFGTVFLSGSKVGRNATMNPKVAHVLAYIAAKYGGPPVMAREVGAALARRGVSVSFWATATAEECRSLPDLGQTCNVFPPIWPLRWFRSPALIELLERSIESLDLLHLHEVWSYPLFSAAKVARKHKKPYIVTPHGTFAQPWRYNAIKKRIYLSMIAREMLDGAAYVHAVVPQEEAGIRDIGYKGPIVVIPNGVNEKEFINLPDPSIADREWPELTGKRVVLYLGRLSPEKGLDRLVHAWRILASNGSCRDCVLVIAGPDDRGYRSVVEGLIQKKSPMNNVMLPGMVLGKYKLALFSRCEISVLPSLSEVMGLSALESLASGKPVLITPGCNFPEVAESGSGLCVPPEPEAIAGALRELLEMSPEEQEAMGARGRDLVFENYTWDVAARRFIEVYRSVLTGENIPGAN